METLLLIDGNAMMHRAFYAIPATFRTTDGTPTNAVYGFLTMLLKVITDFSPHYVIICFDTPKPTFRKEMFQAYQAHRAKIADEFRVQIPIIKEMLEKAGITQIEKGGFEADDLIGTLATRYKETSKVLILTGDKDIMQLVDKNVYVMTPVTGISSIKLYDEAEVKKKLGVTPKDIPELKGLMGDPSDNYGGAKGIGPKTACDLLDRFGSIESLLENTDKIENLRVKTLIETQRDNIILSKTLATIKTDVPIEMDLETARFNAFGEDLNDFLDNLQMHSLVERLNLHKRPTPVEKEKEKEKKKEKKKEDPPQQEGLF